MGACNHLVLVNYLSGFFSRCMRRRLPAIYQVRGLDICNEQVKLTATSRAYLNKTPLFSFSSPLPDAFHSSMRRTCSSSSTSQLMTRFSESTMIRSPSFTRAMGPPKHASGTTWPMINLYRGRDCQRSSWSTHRAIFRPVRCSTESTIRNKGGGISQTCSYQRSSWTYKPLP